MNYCPDWLYECCVASATADFLQMDVPLQAICVAYQKSLSEDYTTIDASDFASTIEEMVIFLNELDAGANAYDLCLHFCFFKLKFISVNEERKVKGWFGSSISGDKSPQFSSEKTIKKFKAFLVSYRHGQMPKMPMNWNPRQESEIGVFQRLAKMNISPLDIFS